MDRKVLFGLAIGAAALLLTGGRRRSLALGLAPDQHSLKHATKRMVARHFAMQARAAASQGNCEAAFHTLARGDYESGQAVAHALSTEDDAPRLAKERKEAATLRRDLRAARKHVEEKCFASPRRGSAWKRDRRTGNLPGV